MNTVIKEIGMLGIIPVIALENASDAEPLAGALCRGGLPCAEVTFRTEAAEEAIRIMTTSFPEMLVGAGTVLTKEQVDSAVNAGAKFIVSPGLNPKVVSYCLDKKIPVIPGITSPSEIEMALELGLEIVKFFPAEAAGGIAMIKAMSAPYGKLKFMPTGGITSQNLREYLNYNKVIACGGSWMVPKDLLETGNFDEIANRTKQAVASMLGFEVTHLGLNASHENEALEIADAFDSLFGMKRNIGNSSVFAGTGIEVMKQPYLGKHGHIAIATDDIVRAVYHLEKQGILFDPSTEKLDSKGNLKAVYFKKEIGGFAIHLLQR